MHKCSLILAAGPIIQTIIVPHEPLLKEEVPLLTKEEEEEEDSEDMEVVSCTQSPIFLIPLWLQITEGTLQVKQEDILMLTDGRICLLNRGNRFIKNRNT